MAIPPCNVTMAIQFNCPYCTSTIRVPDDAAGKKGTCPRCGTAILVPEIAPPPGASASPPASAAPPAGSAPDTASVRGTGHSAPAADFAAPGADASPPVVPAPPVPAEPGPFAPTEEPVFPGPPPAPPRELAQFEPVVPTTEAPPTSYARALKRRKKKKSGLGLWIPIVGGIGLITVVIYFFWKDRPTLNGELAAVRLEEFAPPPGGVGRGDVSDLSEQTVDYVLDELAENPARLTSSLMETEFRGTPRGIEVHLFEGQKTAFFRVEPRKNKDFDQWVQEHAAELEQPWQKEFQDAVRRFFKEFDDTQGDLPDLPGYRDPLGLGAMVGSVGYNMAAIVGGKSYRCVYEDAERRLYFLLPQGTRQFELTGRQLDDGRTLFPGSYLVKVE